jgi:hypothetical protein
VTLSGSLVLPSAGLHSLYCRTPNLTGGSSQQKCKHYSSIKGLLPKMYDPTALAGGTSDALQASCAQQTCNTPVLCLSEA